MNDNLDEWEQKFQKYLLENPSNDASHDLGHFQRVWRLARKLSSPTEDQLVLLAACYFHDIVNYPKNDPRRTESSTHAGVKACEILSSMKFPCDKLESVAHCIEAHSFSANIEPRTNEAKIVQDADRMESLGAIGLARTFYVAGRMGSELFDAKDPFAENRSLDDQKYAVDHFKVKLLNLPETMKSDLGRKEAEQRAEVLVRFLDELKQELFTL